MQIRKALKMLDEPIMLIDNETEFEELFSKGLRRSGGV
tara:strand:- start:505 stop:618 length:114 start_codon:yes stop_codon:yes gene_type:complete